MEPRHEYPLHLKSRGCIIIEGKPHVVHSVTPHDKERIGILHNKVSVETTTGCMLMLPITQMVEVWR